MRVVVHHPERVEDGETVPASVSAYRLGKIDDHVDLLTGKTTPRAEVAAILLEQARAEFPGQDVSVEYLHEVEVDDETGKAVRHEWRAEPPEVPVPPGENHERTLSVEQSQEASA